jgi:NAD-dependent dihydropyrimidine dehydrogenase PreA subunit
VICKRCGAVFCVDMQEDSFYLSRGRVLYCSKMCKKKSRPSHRIEKQALGGNPRKIRRQVRRLRLRDGDNCHLCGLPIDFSIADANDPMRCSRDHVVPRGLGGDLTVANMRLAHRRCNTERDQELLAAEGTLCER